MNRFNINNKRKTRSNIRHKSRRTRRRNDLTSMYSRGFIERMSAPLNLIPISENDERVIRHRQLYPPDTRTDDELNEDYFNQILKERAEQASKKKLNYTR